VACTEFLTAMHASDRTTAGIDAGGILPGYTGVLVRDGYAGYQHLARCGARLVRRALSRYCRDGRIPGMC
jgi:transposase